MKQGTRYFYSITYKKEEATLEVLLGSGRPKLGDLLGKSNSSVSPELRDVVVKWFIKNKVSY